MKNKKGFTLIELLVVIAIIGLLGTLSIIALNNARAKSRDAKRIADVKQMQTALELYFNDNQAYPDGIVDGIKDTETDYMLVTPQPPQPPSAITTYTYSINSDKDSYTINYTLEGTVGSLVKGPHTATNASIK